MADQLPKPAEASHRIMEGDLATLERTLPQLADAMMPILNNRLRTQLRQVQHILSNVRWQYGPATNVTTIPVDD
jgi:hypothetical protein